MTRAAAPLAPLAAPDAGRVATREAYGKALLELGETRPDVVVLDADLSGSTKTKAFGQRWPERFFNIGVAEANMMGTAAGLAAMGKTVFASSFAMFAAGKAWEQLRQSVCVPNLDVKVCATHAGLTVGEDGKSHQMLEDVTLMRVLPNMKVIVPADGVEAHQAVIAAASTPGSGLRAPVAREHADRAGARLPVRAGPRRGAARGGRRRAVARAGSRSRRRSWLPTCWRATASRRAC